jgi:hypothetical protein
VNLFILDDFTLNPGDLSYKNIEGPGL